jgi:predicted amidohydrolase
MHQKAHLGRTVRVYAILTVSWRGTVATLELTFPKMVALQALAAEHKLQQIVSAAVKIHVTHDSYEGGPKSNENFF